MWRACVPHWALSEMSAKASRAQLRQVGSIVVGHGGPAAGLVKDLLLQKPPASTSNLHVAVRGGAIEALSSPAGLTRVQHLQLTSFVEEFPETRGRPPAPPGQGLRHQINLRLSTEDQDKVYAACLRTDEKNISRWIRRAIRLQAERDLSGE